jgi:hypothetical protein
MGGPGYNCGGFEVSTAQELANNGFYVIVYDRRRKVARHMLMQSLLFRLLMIYGIKLQSERLT